MADLILGIGGVLLTVALIPSLVSDDKPAIATSLMTAAILYSFGGAYWSLELWFACIVAIITGSIWLALAIQVWNRDYGEEAEESTGTSTY